MKYKLFTLMSASMAIINKGDSHQLDFSKIKTFEHQLDDVMELVDTSELKVKLQEVEHQYKEDPTELNKARLGIVYHETALNLGFFSKTEYKGYAQKSFDQLSELFQATTTTKELIPFVASYRASALSLVGAETKKLKLLGEAFALFDEAVTKYHKASYLPEFLRGSVAENLPWFFFSKRKYAKKDFQSIIDQHTQDTNFANWKIMSFTYWAWANQHKGKKHRAQAIAYLDKAISLDPVYKAARKRAEELKDKWTK
jgi:tetratricopeptide (TPR) repeat protein